LVAGTSRLADRDIGSFTSFSGAANESADSRVYAGIHFRSACEDGLMLGRKIGQRVAMSYLLPLKN
jgi:hypothetical protein